MLISNLLILTFYLDESGNSGDMVKAGTAFDFGQQPVFVLAGVGLADGDVFAVELERLRMRYRINGREFKSAALKDKARLGRRSSSLSG
jgi:hypothetical protein